MSTGSRSDVRAAFAAECRGIEQTLAGVPADAWGRPGLGEWSVRELVAHILRAVTRVGAYLDHPPQPPADHATAGAEPLDRVAYWRTDLAAQRAAIAQRARDDAAGMSPETVVADFAAAREASQERLRGLAPDHPITTPAGVMDLDEYLATRVLELVVHHMDLRAALDLPPQSDPAAARLVADTLEALLGAPRPRNLGRTRFILAATGRVEVDDERFPVLS